MSLGHLVAYDPLGALDALAPVAGIKFLRARLYRRCFSWTTTNVGARNVEACLKPFRRVHPKDIKSTRLEVQYSRNDCFEDPKWRRLETWPR